MTGEGVFAVFAALSLVWTAIWIWVVSSAPRELSYSAVAPRIAVLRRRLLYGLLGVGAVALVASGFALPYAPVQALVGGRPQIAVRAVAEQWAWTFSRNRIPAGVPVEFLVSSKDVNHSFALFNPQGALVAQVQAMPGYVNHLIHVFNKPGVYTVRCLELCGVAHAFMSNRLTVTP
ncbi:MAG TPA: hypothetical protein VGR91_14995 [Stellaceae bacterium]|nr:hypothetical protein [Stellaceae bacterium]